MPWLSTTRVKVFLEAVGDHLRTDPVANNALLTEAAFWARLDPSGSEGRFGWWVGPEGPSAAFVDLPEHPMICSSLPPESAEGLLDLLPAEARLAVAAADVGPITRLWADRGGRASQLARLTVMRWEREVPAPGHRGRARVAEAADLSLLRSWFARFQADHPEDTSDPAFVVDHPLQDGAVVIWEDDGVPRAMASRTPTVAAMTRMGLCFQPEEGRADADAAFAAAVAAAAASHQHVLVLVDHDSEAAARSAGFTPAATRCVLHLRRES